MKAAMNGVINLSIPDGWWLEGYNGKNGWSFGSADDGTTGAGRDASDAYALYDILEKEVIPLYYSASLDGIPHGWVKMMKESIKSNAPRFSAHRMVKEYVSRYYPDDLRGGRGLCVRAQGVSPYFPPGIRILNRTPSPLIPVSRIVIPVIQRISLIRNIPRPVCFPNPLRKSSPLSSGGFCIVPRTPGPDPGLPSADNRIAETRFPWRRELSMRLENACPIRGSA